MLRDSPSSALRSRIPSQWGCLPLHSSTTSLAAFYWAPTLITYFSILWLSTTLPGSPACICHLISSIILIIANPESWEGKELQSLGAGSIYPFVYNINTPNSQQHSPENPTSNAPSSRIISIKSHSRSLKCPLIVSASHSVLLPPRLAPSGGFKAALGAGGAPAAPPWLCHSRGQWQRPAQPPGPLPPVHLLAVPRHCLTWFNNCNSLFNDVKGF